MSRCNCRALGPENPFWSILSSYLQTLAQQCSLRSTDSTLCHLISSAGLALLQQHCLSPCLEGSGSVLIADVGCNTASVAAGCLQSFSLLPPPNKSEELE